jgi:hypothetical protein
MFAHKKPPEEHLSYHMISTMVVQTIKKIATRSCIILQAKDIKKRASAMPIWIMFIISIACFYFSLLFPSFQFITIGLYLKAEYIKTQKNE